MQGSQYTASQNVDPDRSLIVWGWVGTFTVVPVGAIIGIILITRDRLGHGIAQLTLSILWMTVAFAALAAPAPAQADHGEPVTVPQWAQPVRQVTHRPPVVILKPFSTTRVLGATHVELERLGGSRFRQRTDTWIPEDTVQPVVFYRKRHPWLTEGNFYRGTLAPRWMRYTIENGTFMPLRAYIWY